MVQRLQTPTVAYTGQNGECSTATNRRDVKLQMILINQKSMFTYSVGFVDLQAIYRINLKSEISKAIGFPSSTTLAMLTGTVWNSTPFCHCNWAYSDTRKPVKVPMMAAS